MAIAGEISRSPWYQLEGRNSGVLAARLGAAAAIAALCAGPVAAAPASRALALVACLAMALANGALWVLARLRPRTLRLAVDTGLVVDAAWATALAHAWGGPWGPLVAAYLFTSLWAALGYSARTGLKAAVLSTLGFLTLVWYAEDGHLGSVAAGGRLAVFWGALAAAIGGAAVNERELRVQRDREAALHTGARALLDAEGRDAMAAATCAAAERLLPGWRARVRFGRAEGEVRLVRAGEDGLVIVPLSVAGEVIGAMECRRRLARGQRRHRVRLSAIRGLETLASGLSNALWRHDLVDALQRQSLTDGLTGLANRRAFDIELARRLDEARRSGRPLTLCLLDVDRFKSFNDTFGHPAGDGALRAVAAALQGACRSADICARYGGEEMAVLMPGTSLSQGLDAAERVRAAVAASPVEPRSVTVSIGVATSDGGVSAELLIEAADRALYAAKEGGRDRVLGNPGVEGAALEAPQAR